MQTVKLYLLISEIKYVYSCIYQISNIIIYVLIKYLIYLLRYKSNNALRYLYKAVLKVIKRNKIIIKIFNILKPDKMLREKNIFAFIAGNLKKMTSYRLQLVKLCLQSGFLFIYLINKIKELMLRHSKICKIVII